ncbi:biopolymer transporter ExbD [Tropicibacter naphthalenivorans]|uniref:Biopolymer transport protein ExbD n=1 Tax=Tropicibacter naphthalenivorans TaxID=441103 RepID=A0A0P1GY55_9RHOB|nr:biopolymer transporter ExbD [Tropicibacter naphthalenivorans]CUH81012.1 Biopolymer transport protein ExbD [Tropicibacter naphthalenivorans]SMC91974.1 outer membrane transport energization protein ExbD [Tropicibacter naphthalenivorans]
MGARLGSGSDDEMAENADINITPFIDVMLVLLIIFMVAAPLSTVDIPVELPVAVADAPQRPSEPVFITLQEDLSLAVGEVQTTLDGLVMEIGIATMLNRDERLYIRADKAVPYGELIAVMNVLRAEGYLKVGLVGLDEASAPPEALPETAETQP